MPERASRKPENLFSVVNTINRVYYSTWSSRKCRKYICSSDGNRPGDVLTFSALKTSLRCKCNPPIRQILRPYWFCIGKYINVQFPCTCRYQWDKGVGFESIDRRPDLSNF